MNTASLLTIPVKWTMILPMIDTTKLNYNDLHNIRDELIIEKMKLDKFFTIFLDSAELDDDMQSVDWKTYKSMLKDYDKVTDMLAQVRRLI